MMINNRLESWSEDGRSILCTSYVHFNCSFNFWVPTVEIGPIVWNFHQAGKFAAFNVTDVEKWLSSAGIVNLRLPKKRKRLYLWSTPKQ